MQTYRYRSAPLQRTRAPQRPPAAFPDPYGLYSSRAMRRAQRPWRAWHRRVLARRSRRIVPVHATEQNMPPLVVDTTHKDGMLATELGIRRTRSEDTHVSELEP